MAKTIVPIELSSTPSIVDNGTATAITIDSSGFVAIGSTPSAWRTSFTDYALDVGRHSALYDQFGGNTFLTNNIYRNNSGALTYKTTNAASYLEFGGGGMSFFNAPSGTADTTATFTNRMTITSSGNVGINTSSPTVGKLQVNDGSGATVAITRTSGATSGNLGVIRFGNTDIDSNLANIIATQDGSTTSSALTFETQSTGGATAERMRIHSSGYITTPNQPMFFAGGLASGSYTQGNAIVFNTERFDRGGNYNTSNGVFTAPVTGIYHFDTTLLISGASSSYLYDLEFYTSNQSYYGQSRNQYSSGSTGWADNYLAHTGSWTVDMDAGDIAYIKYSTFGGGGIYTNAVYTHFSGYLVG